VKTVGSRHPWWARQCVRPRRVAALVLVAGGCVADSPPADSVADTVADSVAGTPAIAPPPGPADTAAAESAEPDTARIAEWTVRDTRVTVAATGVATLVAVRAAAHAQFDRIVIEFEGAATPSYRLEYVDRPVRQCGSGEAVPLAGDAWLSIQLEPAQAHTEQGEPTVAERSRSPRLPNLLELKLICDFEAVVEWVAAVASPQPYRVAALRSPARLVVDIRHPARTTR
jgi:hypothetical protein